jgi:hypothetical protein
MTDPEVVKLLRWLADEIDNGRAQPKMVEVNFDDDVEVEPRSWRDSPAEPPPGAAWFQTESRTRSGSQPCAACRE